VTASVFHGCHRVRPPLNAAPPKAVSSRACYNRRLELVAQITRSTAVIAFAMFFNVRNRIGRVLGIIARMMTTTTIARVIIAGLAKKTRNSELMIGGQQHSAKKSGDWSFGNMPENPPRNWAVSLRPR
jgi:hypothetical protein